MCFVLDKDLEPKDGQIAHVDRDRTNHDLSNLAYLCMKHHNAYDSLPSQSSRYKAAELLEYRGLLYSQLGTFDKKIILTLECDEDPIDTIHSVVGLIEKSLPNGKVRYDAHSKGSLVIALSCDDEAYECLLKLHEAGELEALLDLGPCTLAEPDREAADALLRRGEEKLEQHQPDEALEIFTAALKLDMHWATLWVAIAAAYMEKFHLYTRGSGSARDLELAARAALKGIEMDFRESTAWITYGAVLGELGYQQDALASVDRALELNERSGSAHFNKGILLSRAGEFEAAYRSLQRAIELGERDAERLLRQVSALRKKPRRER